MGFENFNLDKLAEDVRKRSQGSRNGNLIYDVQTGKFVSKPSNEPVPKSSVVSNQMTDEGFAA